MKFLKISGVAFVFIAILIFTAILFVGPFKLTENDFNEALSKKQQVIFNEDFKDYILNKNFNNSFAISHAIEDVFIRNNNLLKEQQRWDEVIWQSPQQFAFPLVVKAAKNSIANQTGIWFFFTIILISLGALMYILVQWMQHPQQGIKNNNIFFRGISARGWMGVLLGFYLISFYILLYWFPAYVANWVVLVNPISIKLSGFPASQWFLYGLLYTLAVVVMGVRMLLKYRGNKYQIFRTFSVMFFQVGFAFLIPEILTRFNQPAVDLKNIWPLDYDLFFEWNLNQLISSGNLGIFMLVWGVLLFSVGVPVFTYFFGKRWYCSWVCGCGGLAETLGDPFRQLSNKSLKAWKFERYSIHLVLLFAVLMTTATLYSYFTENYSILGVETHTIQQTYGFFIGSAFAGVVGTGFYPLMGNRVWCRFGCPLAAYIGFVQRFKSRFRITTNGGQCISCGNCSTYCEMGIDVRWYAQRGQNIVRSSCVGCGVCSSVCPRGVLKLENGKEKGRINDNPILIGNQGITLKQ